jgi:hypothetical protein
MFPNTDRDAQRKAQAEHDELHAQYIAWAGTQYERGVTPIPFSLWMVAHYQKQLTELEDERQRLFDLYVTGRSKS